MNNQNTKSYHYNKNLSFTKNDWKGNLMLDSQFVNEAEKKKQNFTTFLKWRMSKNPFAEEKKKETYKLKVIENTDFVSSEKNGIQWLGHSSFIIKTGNSIITTDPCYYSLIGVRRHIAVPIPPEKIKNIDFLLVTHGHRDHFDVKSYSILAKNNPDMKALVPLKFSPLLKNKIRSQQAGWYQRYVTGSDITIDFVPAYHWHKRGLTDFNNILWGSFIIKDKKNRTIFFCGDSTYGPHFKEIGRIYGHIDICIMPVGAYRPAYIMKESHMTPEEAYQAFLDLNGKIMIPMHYGTYDLADELMGEPEQRMRALQKKYPGTVEIIYPGEVYNL